MPKPPIDSQNAMQKIREFFRIHHRAPSFEEVRALFSYRSKASAHFLIKQLIEKNFLHKDSKGRILWDQLAGVKLLGSVQAGLPAAEEEVHTDTMNLDEFLVKNHQQTFLLKVSGDSMIDAGIHDGDFVLIERGREVKNHDIIIAEVDGEWTLKYYEKEGGCVRLVPANKKYSPIIPKVELKTGGVLVAVIRKYK
jgi:SOS regulatory protein LexA